MGRAVKQEALLSVVVPVSKMSGRLGNLSRWLNHELDPRIEVVLVHDMQDEKTGPELRRLVAWAGGSRIRLLENQFGSPGAARNAGALLVETKWIAFWDSDDIPNTGTILGELLSLKIEPEILIGNFIVQTITRKYEVLHSSRIQQVGLSPGLWRMVFLTNSINGITFPEYKMAEDQVYLAKLRIGSRAIHYSDAFFYTYFRGDPNQLTSNKDLTNRKALIDLRELISQKPFEKDSFIQIAFARLFTSALIKQPRSMTISDIISSTMTLVKFSPRNNLYLFYSVLKKVGLKRGD